MAACFGADSDSDASSSDISAPPASQARSSKALASRIQGFTTISGEKLQGQIGQSQTGLQNQIFKKPQLRILPETDSEENLSGYTPPPGPAKRKGTFKQPIEMTPEKPRRALHEFMKPSKVNWKNSSRAKRLLESHSSFSENSSEREGLGDICPGFSTYYSRPGHVPGESSAKRKEREFLAWEKANSEEQSFQNEMSPVKSSFRLF
ncbi:unnamed protein product [Calypogeia fissa]